MLSDRTHAVRVPDNSLVTKWRYDRLNCAKPNLLRCYHEATEAYPNYCFQILESEVTFEELVIDKTNP